MFGLFANLVLLGKVLFGVSLLFMLVSLALSIREITISFQVLNMELGNMLPPDQRKP